MPLKVNACQGGGGEHKHRHGNDKQLAQHTPVRKEETQVGVCVCMCVSSLAAEQYFSAV